MKPSDIYLPTRQTFTFGAPVNSVFAFCPLFVELNFLVAVGTFEHSSRAAVPPSGSRFRRGDYRSAGSIHTDATISSPCARARARSRVCGWPGVVEVTEGTARIGGNYPKTILLEKQAGNGISRRHIEGSNAAKGLQNVKYSFTVHGKPKSWIKLAR